MILSANRQPYAWFGLLLLALYAVLPQWFAPVVSTEGYEAAVTSYINQKYLLHSAVLLTPFNFGNRPGEYYLYAALVRVFQVDALLIGQVVSSLAFVLGGWSSIRLARQTAYGDAFSALLSYLLLFNLSASAAQVSSCNLAMALVVTGLSLLACPRLWPCLLGLLSLALAIFCRLDSVIFLPLVPMVMFVSGQGAVRAFVRGSLLSLAALLLAMLCYHQSGLALFQELFGANQVSHRPGSWEYSMLRSVLVPFTGILALIGTVADFRDPRRQAFHAPVRLLIAFLPTVLIVLAYKSHLASPRFFTSSSPLLALAACRGIVSLRRLRGRPRSCMWLGIALLTLFCYQTRQPHRIWDGFRYQRATFTTPYEIYRLKTYLGQLYPRLEQQALDREAGVSLEHPAAVVVTSWAQYNQLVRALVLRGAVIEGRRQLVLGTSPMLDEVTWRLGAKRYRLYLFEREREFSDAQSLIRALHTLPADGPGFCLVAERSLTNSLLHGWPGASVVVLGEYDRFELNSSHWIRLNPSPSH